jgi:hypothetical protein
MATTIADDGMNTTKRAAAIEGDTRESDAIGPPALSKKISGTSILQGKKGAGIWLLIVQL